MLIVHDKAIYGSSCPGAMNLLRQLPPNATFNVAQQLRHPESIYQLSLEKVGNKFCDVAECYMERVRQYAGPSSPPVLEIDDLVSRQQTLLHTLQEHVDELWLILKTLVDPATTSSSFLFADKYVIASKLAGAKSFEQAIAPYKASLRIVNKLKHQQGYLRGVSMWTISGPHFGYFLEEPDSAGVLGPSPEIHPDQKASSFARELLVHFMNVYMCSQKLQLAIQRALNSKGVNVKLAPHSGLPIWEKAVDSALQIPDAFFPSEFRKGIPQVSRESGSGKLVMRLPRRIEPAQPRIVKVSCSTKIDGHSPTFKTPLI